MVWVGLVDDREPASGYTGGVVAGLSDVVGMVITTKGSRRLSTHVQTQTTTR